MRGKGKRKRRQERTPSCGTRPLPPSRCICPTWVWERGVTTSELSQLLWAQEVVPSPAFHLREKAFPDTLLSQRSPELHSSLPNPIPASYKTSLSLGLIPLFWRSRRLAEGSPGLAIPGVWSLGHLGERQGHGKGVSLSWPWQL